jgi:hypothetical protein
MPLTSPYIDFRLRTTSDRPLSQRWPCHAQPSITPLTFRSTSRDLTVGQANSQITHVCGATTCLGEIRMRSASYGHWVGVYLAEPASRIVPTARIPPPAAYPVLTGNMLYPVTH